MQTLTSSSVALVIVAVTVTIFDDNGSTPKDVEGGCWFGGLSYPNTSSLDDCFPIKKSIKTFTLTKQSNHNIK